MNPALRPVLAAAAAPLLALALVAPASAAPFPDELQLPTASSPEGITDGPGTLVFAGSRNTGSITRFDVRTGERSYLVAPVAPVQGVTRVVGLDHDQSAGTVVTAGGSTGLVNSYDVRTGELLSSAVVPGRPASSRFLNDVVSEGGTAYVTDSRFPELVVVEDGVARILPLTGDFVQPQGFGANGIVDVPGKDLLLVAGPTLYYVDPATGVTRRLTQTGGRTLLGGDGLELRGRTLYVTNGFDSPTANRDSVAVVQLGKGDTFTTTGEVIEAGLERPTTSALVGGALYAVNGKFDTPGATEFEVVRLEL